MKRTPSLRDFEAIIKHNEA